MPKLSYYTVTPSAARLTGSLRDIGYDFPSSIADLVDNSIAAGASEVRIDTVFDGPDSRVIIADDGNGMSPAAVNEALRFGSRRDYEVGDLGRYGLGLKTASLSQCRVLTVASRRSGSRRTTVRQLDLDLIADWDQWIVRDAVASHAIAEARQRLNDGMNTVILWEDLDRVLPGDMTGGWARRRLDAVTAKMADHLSMVFHRFLDASLSAPTIAIVVNGKKLDPWDPFATTEPSTIALPQQTFELEVSGASSEVRLSRYILPPRDRFSSPAAFDHHSGPLKWNRQQGLYIYRADRLVQWGGWSGIRGIDEHTKLARAALDYETVLDPLFNINVAKMRVSVPTQLRQMLERPIHELCLQAGAVYRRAARNPNSGEATGRSNHGSGTSCVVRDSQLAGLALRAAAFQSGDFEALKRIAQVLMNHSPDIAAMVGLDTIQP